MKKSFLIILIIFSTNFSQSPKSNNGYRKIDSLLEKKSSTIDSIIIDIKKTSIDNQKHYLEILEKTNQQLSLWSNPYGILVGVLSILFTLLAVVATIIIYIQSKDFKGKINRFINSGKEALEKVIDEKSEVIKQIDAKIEHYKIDLEKVQESKKDEIQTEIDNLISQRKDVTNQLSVTVDAFPIYQSVFDRNERLHKCTQCGFGYKVSKPTDPYSGLWGGEYTVKCPNPKCGNIDKIPNF